MMDDADRPSWKIQLASPFGRSGEMCEEHLAFDSSLVVSRRQNTHISFVLLPCGKGEHLPCVVVLSGISTVVWSGDPVHSWAEHWALETVKTNI